QILDRTPRRQLTRFPSSVTRRTASLEISSPFKLLTGRKIGRAVPCAPRMPEPTRFTQRRQRTARPTLRHDGNLRVTSPLLSNPSEKPTKVRRTTFWKKRMREADAKEVGMRNPAEETLPARIKSQRPEYQLRRSCWPKAADLSSILGRVLPGCKHAAPCRERCVLLPGSVVTTTLPRKQVP